MLTILIWHFSAADFYLKVTEDDNSGILIVSLLLFVLRIHTIPRHLKQSETMQRIPIRALWTLAIYLKHHEICDGFKQSKLRGILEMGETVHWPYFHWKFSAFPWTWRRTRQWSHASPWSHNPTLGTVAHTDTTVDYFLSVGLSMQHSYIIYWFIPQIFSTFPLSYCL